MNLAFTVVIPARLASTRLPNKPLADIGGKPMVVRVAEQAKKTGAQAVWVATDSVEVMAACEAHKIPALITRSDHPSGTDRLAEVAMQLNLADDAIIVNVQGDEPLIAPSLIQDVAQHLSLHADCAIATAAHPISKAEDIFNPNVVKVVLDSASRALYFSRAAIPWARDAYQKHWPDINAMPMPQTAVYRHIGLYAYRCGFLKKYPTMSVSPIETAESLEQLRALWHGERIAVKLTQNAPATGVDTQEDLDRVRILWNQGT